MAAEGDVVTFERDGHRISISAPGEELTAAMTTLSAGAATFSQLADIGADPVRLTLLTQRLARSGWLRFSVAVDGAPALTATPVAEPAGGWPELEPGARYVLSRFAYLHRDGGTLLIRSPLSYVEAAVLDPRVAELVSRLAEPYRWEKLTDRLGRGAVEQIMRLLLHAGLVCEDGDEDEDPALRQWEFHDLLFHTSSRDGRHDRPTGGTYRFRGIIDPLPAIRPMAGDGEHVVALAVPAERPSVPESSLFSVLERRTSIRRHGTEPLTVEQLGEFLFHSARITEVLRPGDEEVCRRPYPGGGGMHELELYIAARDCAGLASGLYHYRAREHALSRVSDMTRPVETLLRDAAFSTASPDDPQILIVIAARFQRLSWKYQSIAYSLILKHVGCLVQTMYLVATAMNLAPCAVGGGNSAVFTKALGESYFTETSVGEFVLGTRSDAAEE